LPTLITRDLEEHVNVLFVVSELLVMNEWFILGKVPREGFALAPSMKCCMFYVCITARFSLQDDLGFKYYEKTWLRVSNISLLNTTRN
jgi:hypothetical protein